MLTHANLMYQVANLPYFIEISAGQSVLSLLPPWHIYERTCSYLVLSKGCKQVRGITRWLSAGDLLDTARKSRHGSLPRPLF